MKVWEIGFNVHHVHPGAKKGRALVALVRNKIALVRKKIAPERNKMARQLFFFSYLRT